MIRNCEGWTAQVAKSVQIDLAVLIFTTSMTMSVHAVALRKLLIGYIGKHTCGNDDTYLHFLQIVYMIASSPTVINAAVTVVLRKTICFSCLTNISSQSCNNVGGQNVNSFSKTPFLSGAGSVNAFTPLFGLVVGFTNLYSSITAELKMLLSRMRALNMHINQFKCCTPTINLHCL